MKVQLKNVRLAFPAIWEAKTVNGEGKPAFSAVLLMEPTDANAATVREALAAVAKDKWGAKADATLKALVAADKVCLHNGDAKADYEGFEGHLYVSARNPTRPTIVDRDRSPLSESDGKPYAGCYVNASIELWAQENSYGKRINASLRGLQFVKDGDAFAGGGAASADEFEQLAEEPLV